MAKTTKKQNSRTETQITKVNGIDPALLASYIEEDASLVGMEQYRIVPRLKVIQSMTSNDLKQKFGEGSLIVRPGDIEVWNKDSDPVSFVPLFFCTEFCKWADLADKGSRAMVERSYDPTSHVAKAARDEDLRYEEYPDQEKKKDKDKWYFRYVEHLRFLGIIVGDHELSGQYVTLSFERGEFGQGKNFISAVMMRKIKIETENGSSSMKAPLWTQVWDLSVGFRDQGDKKWYGIDYAPAEESTIPFEDFEQFKSYHEELKELFDKQRLLVDDDEVESGTAGDSTDF